MSSLRDRRGKRVERQQLRQVVLNQEEEALNIALAADRESRALNSCASSAANKLLRCLSLAWLRSVHVTSGCDNIAQLLAELRHQQRHQMTNSWHVLQRKMLLHQHKQSRVRLLVPFLWPRDTRDEFALAADELLNADRTGRV